MKVTPFGDLFEFIRNGMNVKQDKSRNGVPITRIETISAGTIDPERVGYADLKPEDCKQWFLKTGDILFSHINSAELVGKCALYQGTPERLVHGMNLLCLRPRVHELDSSYARWLVKSPGFRSKLRNFINKAVNQASISIGNLRTIQVSIPSLVEQRRIAAILDKVDALRQKRRAALQKLDPLTQSIFLEAFNSQGAARQKWPTRMLASLGKVTTGRTPPSELKGMFGGDIPFVTPGDLEGVWRSRAAKRTITKSGAAMSKVARAGSTAVCCIGATIGKMGLIGTDFAFNQQINVAEWGAEIDDLYGYFAMTRLKDEICLRGASTTLPILKKSEFEKLVITVPPIDRQKQFRLQIECIVRHHLRLLGSEEQGDSLFSALQSQAFKGEL